MARVARDLGAIDEDRAGVGFDDAGEEVLERLGGIEGLPQVADEGGGAVGGGQRIAVLARLPGIESRLAVPTMVKIERALMRSSFIERSPVAVSASMSVMIGSEMRFSAVRVRFVTMV